MPQQNRIVRGSLSIFLAQASIVPTGILTVIFLTDRLGAMAYGAYTLVATTILWLEWSIMALFGKTVIKFISEADDWRPAGTTALRLYLSISTVAAVGLWILSPLVAQGLDEPALTAYLRLFALDIPVFCTAQAHQQILLGIGKFSQQALIATSRWVIRLLLIVGFIQTGWSVNGAILGCLGTSWVELFLCRCYVRPSLRGQMVFPPGVWRYVLPLVAQALLMRGYQQMDLYLLKVLGGDLAQAGIYGATRNLSLIVLMAGTSVSAVLLSDLNRIVTSGDADLARTTVRNSMRFSVCLLPVVGLATGAADEIPGVLFSAEFAAMSALLGPIMLGTVALVVVLVSGSILVASQRPTWTLWLIVPMMITAALSHLFLVPHHQALGAACSIALSSVLGALLACGLVYQIWRVYPPLSTLLRSLIVSGVAFGIAAAWPASGLWVLIKLMLATAMSLGTFILLGEISDRELAAIAPSLLPGFSKKN
ncbi:MAG: oligosaccharide flippase family protein [Cyanobacteria bacterium P01_A01_bin.114]